MFRRLVKPIESNSFFIFGARGTGKSTYIHDLLENRGVFFDLLDDETFDRLLRQPKIIEEVCDTGNAEWIVIDEVQRLPKLLNLVHRMIEKKKQKFALTGSSSRKLRRGSANLLAGRAFVNLLFPLTSEEVGVEFQLNSALHWGTLPKIYSLRTPEEKTAYLRSYCFTYIKEEIQTEQLVRKLEPFREFLSVAAQMSGKLVNYSAIARDVGAQVPTVQTYYQILEDTYLGFTLPHFHRSIRKSQIETPKFYLFDNGVKKALEGSLDSEPSPSTSTYGELFESFIVQEVFRLNQYLLKDYRISYYRTKNDVEIDLILSKGKRIILIEIKSSERIDEFEVRKFSRLQLEFKRHSFITSAYYVSRDPFERTIEGIHCLCWQKFLKTF